MEARKVAGSNVECSVIIAYKKVEHGEAGMACHAFDKLVDKGRDSSIADGHSVEGL